jgi:hypothetical protein
LSTQKWTFIVPAALVALILAAVFGLDLAKGGAAKPPDTYLGAAKGDQFPYIPPTATPEGAQPTPRPTLGAPAGSATAGDSTERDNKRRNDLLALLGAADELKKRDGSYPSTNGNVQTICNYQNIDVGCGLKDFLDPLPFDPSRDPVKNGYWYSSDGKTAKFYASLEGEIPEEQRCITSDAELIKKAVLICVEAK